MTREKQIDEFAYSQVDCEFFDARLHEGIIIGTNGQMNIQNLVW